MGAWSYVRPRLETALRAFAAGGEDHPAAYADVAVPISQPPPPDHRPILGSSVGTSQCRASEVLKGGCMSRRG